MSKPVRIEERQAQPYLAIAAEVDGEAAFRRAVDGAFPELFDRLGERALEPAGAPLIRYLELDSEDEPIAIEIGVPVAEPAAEDGRIASGVLPAGRYATYLHVGPYASDDVFDLRAARAELLGDLERAGLEIASSRSDRGTRLEACVERYLVDLMSEADFNRWETEIAYLIRG